MAARWFSGQGWCDVVATTAGWALVRMDGLDVVCVEDNAEIWRITASEPIEYLRAATDGTEIRAIGYGTSTGTARYFTSTTETDLDPVLGQWPVALTYESADWTAYLCRTATEYVRWPLAGAEPAATVNPFLAGTNLGILQIIAGVPVWRESEADPGTNYRVTLNDVTFVFPMVAGTVTVGQSLGPPTNTNQIIASYETTLTATAFAMAGYDPHIAALADGRFAIACRTQAVPLPYPQNVGSMSRYGGAALLLAPPWTPYKATASTDVPLAYAQYDQPVIDRRTGVITKPWKDYLSELAKAISTPIDLTSIAVTNGTSPSVNPPTPITNAADVLAGTDISGFPNGRLVLDTANVEWDFGTVNEAEADLTDTAVTPGTYGDDTHVAQFTVDQKGRLTAAAEVEITFPSSSGGWIEGLFRTLGDGASTAFPLPDVAESILFASVAGAVTDPLTYTLTGSDDEITFDAAPGVGDVVTVNYVTASA